jgi:hypothetical protein
MNKTATVRIKGRLYGRNGELYATVHERRLLWARCEPEIIIEEHATQVPVLGVVGHCEKVYRCAVVLCGDVAVNIPTDNKFIRDVTEVCLRCDLFHKNGAIETVTVNNLTCDDLDYDGEWRFEAALTTGAAEKLLRYFDN